MFTKISYAVYLVQFPVFFYNVGITRHVDEFKPRMLVIYLTRNHNFVVTNTIYFLATITGNIGDINYCHFSNVVCRNAISEFEKIDFQGNERKNF